MAKLNRFIINSDYDSLKIINQISETLTIQSFTMTNGGAGPVYTFSIAAQPGVTFDLVSCGWSVVPGKKTGTPSFGFTKKYHNDLIIVWCDVYIRKNSASGYTVEVRFYKIDTDPSVLGVPVTIPTSTLDIKITQQVPSEQQ